MGVELVEFDLVLCYYFGVLIKDDEPGGPERVNGRTKGVMMETYVVPQSNAPTNSPFRRGIVAMVARGNERREGERKREVNNLRKDISRSYNIYTQGHERVGGKHGPGQPVGQWPPHASE